MKECIGIPDSLRNVFAIVSFYLSGPYQFDFDSWPCLFVEYLLHERLFTLCQSGCKNK